MSVNASHGRVEHARQKLVNAEEAYLRAHGWVKALFVGEWLWIREAALRPEQKATLYAMQRTDAVQFQHTTLGDDS
jgi:hypothetical protein